MSYRLALNTDYLLLGKNPGSKLDDAKSEGTNIIEERAFKKLLETGNV